MHNLIKVFIALFISLLIFSCSHSTELTDIYSDEAFTGKVIKKMLVLGMTKDEWKKKVYENEFRSVLMSYNVEVLTAWQELPKGEKLNKETFEKYFKDKNIDAVLVAIEGGEITEKTLYSAGSGNVHVGVGFYGFYASTSSYYFNSDYLAEEKVVHMRINLYETKDAKLIWSAKSQSFEPKSAGDVIKTVSQNIVGELYRQGIIK